MKNISHIAGEANAKKAAYESRIGTLERDLTQLRSSLAAAQAEGQQVSTQLQQKVHFVKLFQLCLKKRMDRLDQ